MIEFIDNLTIIIGAVSENMKKLTKEYKEYKRQESERRSRMTADERYREDRAKFNRRLCR